MGGQAESAVSVAVSVAAAGYGPAWREQYPMFGKTTKSDGWLVYVLHQLVLMLSILEVPAETVCECGDDPQRLWNMVLDHKDRDDLLNNGKKWNREVGAEYFCAKTFAPQKAVVFAWDADKSEWAPDKRRKRNTSAQGGILPFTFHKRIWGQ